MMDAEHVSAMYTYFYFCFYFETGIDNFIGFSNTPLIVIFGRNPEVPLKNKHAKWLMLIERIARWQHGSLYTMIAKKSTKKIQKAPKALSSLKNLMSHHPQKSQAQRFPSMTQVLLRRRTQGWKLDLLKWFEYSPHNAVFTTSKMKIQY